MDKKTGDKLESRICWLISPSGSKLKFLEDTLSKFVEVDIWNDPEVGNFFRQITTSGSDLDQIIVGNLNPNKMNNPNYFFSTQHKTNWILAVREFLLTRIDAQFKDLRKIIIIKDLTAIKCPDIISESLPNSKIIFLPEDGRNVVAENLQKDLNMGENDNPFNNVDTDKIKDRQKLLGYYSTFWDVTMNNSLQAFENHDNQLKLLIRGDKISKNEEMEKIIDFLRLKKNTDELVQSPTNENHDIKYNELLTEKEKIFCEKIMHNTLQEHGFLN